ncbi:hypothetical protein CEXT_209951 [Caerostris extrusa]|uniref:Uncharacterized protein n=1 Tax=Caerostris extrusa TaxID=172846 RepID=A0AAV4V0S4_CAEEX|nr:hypothetical protein CEXT_209951 [Caerostris extrusa]
MHEVAAPDDSCDCEARQLVLLCSAPLCLTSTHLSAMLPHRLTGRSSNAVTKKTNCSLDVLRIGYDFVSSLVS